MELMGFRRHNMKVVPRKTDYSSSQMSELNVLLALSLKHLCGSDPSEESDL